MSFKRNTNCETCIHGYVCRIKKEIEIVENHIKQDVIFGNAYVDITVRCRYYMADEATRTPNA